MSPYAGQRASDAPSPYWWGLFSAKFQQQAPAASWCTLRSHISSRSATAPTARSCPQLRRPLCHGQSQSWHSSRIRSRLTPLCCWDNKYLTPEHSTRPGCSPASRRHVQGRQIGRLLEEENLTGWRAARPPWPPATAPASRRASLPDTSPRCVTGHWVVSHARNDLRGLPHHREARAGSPLPSSPSPGLRGAGR